MWAQRDGPSQRVETAGGASRVPRNGSSCISPDSLRPRRTSSVCGPGRRAPRRVRLTRGFGASAAGRAMTSSGRELKLRLSRACPINWAISLFILGALLTWLMTVIVFVAGFLADQCLNGECLAVYNDDGKVGLRIAAFAAENLTGHS